MKTTYNLDDVINIALSPERENNEYEYLPTRKRLFGLITLKPCWKYWNGAVRYRISEKTLIHYIGKYCIIKDNKVYYLSNIKLNFPNDFSFTKHFKDYDEAEKYYYKIIQKKNNHELLEVEID